MILDFITQQPIRETDKELVRQEVARAMSFEYQIAPDAAFSREAITMTCRPRASHHGRATKTAVE